MELVDSHCHLDDPRLDPLRDAALERARAVGVRAIVVPAVDARSWQRTRDCCARAPTGMGLYPAYGLHPYFTDHHRDADIDALGAWLRDCGAVAVGECGLDHHVPGLDRERQRVLFEAQVALARDLGLPVIVHARKAVDDVIGVLRRYPGVRADVHSFSGSEQQAYRLVDLGAVIGIGNVIAFERARRLRRVVSTLPLEHIVVETDAPDQPGPARPGALNEPVHVRDVVREIARLRDMDEDEVAACTAGNARRLFRLPDGPAGSDHVG
ncbi:MAG: TatD family hydrolase [Gammaproteobacteria bacterium]